MAGVLLEIEGVRRTFPEFMLEAHFAVRSGEFFSILGPSGSGKTTLLRLIAGLERPEAGRIVLAGEDVTARPAHRRRVGMVFQDYALFPHLTAGWNVAYGLAIKGVPPRERRRRAGELLALTGLAGFEDRDVSTLSGGEKQRVALARALAPEPLLVLLDEPYSALDQHLRLRLRREVRDLQRRAGFTAIFVTHSQEEALCLSDRLLVMAGGRVRQVGTPLEIYRCPESEYVAGFIGAMNRIPARVDAEAREIGVDGRIQALPDTGRWPGGEGLLCLRPEDCRLEAGETAPAVPVMVQSSEFTGPTVAYTVRGAGWTASVLHLGCGAPVFQPGDRAWLVFSLEAALFIPGMDRPT
ncbi:MAG: ABC transporter ATP-binding protein [Patescibacteria group bacterium]